MNYRISKNVTHTFDQAIEKVTEELKKEGFGVLTTIDMKETLHKKLGVEIGRYTILGACNPQFAHRSLQIEQEIGLLLPCNVIVYEKDNTVTVSAFDPGIIGTVISNPAILPVAAEVRERLQRVIAVL